MLPYKVGDMLYLHPLERDGDGRYKARIIDVQQYIHVELPLRVEGKGWGRFTKGEKVEVYFFGPDQVPYSFQSRVVGHREGWISSILLEQPDAKSVIRHQQRQYVRVPCALHLKLHLVLKEKEEEAHVQVQTVDLSGGGLAFVMKEALFGIDDPVSWELDLPDSSGSMRTVSGQAKVKRVDPPEEPGLAYRYALAFTEISEPDRQKIIGYCFQRQLEIKRKTGMKGLTS